MEWTIDSTNLQVRSQTALIKFLDTDLDLAFTMLETARIERELDPSRVPVILGKVRHTLETVRVFTGRIQDLTVQQRIQSRTDELEAALAKV
jgi:hypothetical protein